MKELMYSRLVSATAGAIAATLGVANAADTDAIQSLVPASVRDKGFVTIAEMSDYPPVSSLNGANVEGMGPDLSNAIAEVLGLKANIVATTFDTMLPGIASKRYDLAHGYFYITAERLRVADFVTDFRDRDSFVAGPNSTLDPAKKDSLCGLKVAVQSGGPHVQYAEKADADCKARNLKPVTVMAFPQQVPAIMAVSSNRADVAIGNMAVVEQLMSDGTKLKVVGEFGGGLNGIAFSKTKDAQQLQDAWKAGIDFLIKSGKYQEILTKWKTTYGVIPASETYRVEADLRGQQRAGL